MIKLQTGALFIALLVCTCCFSQSIPQPQDNAVKMTVEKMKGQADDTAKVNALLSASNYFVNKPGTAPGDMSAALSFSKRALDLALKLNDSEEIGKSYTVLSQIYRENGDKATGMAYLQKGLALLEKYPKPAATAEAYFEASNYYDLESPSLHKKIAYYLKGLQFLEASSPKPIKLAGSLKFMGDLYQCNAEFARSAFYLRRALVIYQSVKYQKLQDIYSLLGSVEMEMLDMSASVRDNLQAAKLAERDRDTTMTAGQVYYNLALVYGTLYDYKSSLTYFKKANVIAEKNKNIKAIFTIDLQIAEAYRKLNHPEESLKFIAAARRLPGIDVNSIDLLLVTLGAYNTMHQYDIGRPYFDQLNKQMPGLDIRLGSVQRAYVTLFDYLLGVRQYRSIHHELTRLLDSAGSTNSLYTVHLEIIAFKADSATGNLISAIKHQNRATELKMLILKKNYDNQIANQRVLFDIEKKDQELSYRAANINHLTHENQLQKASITNQQLIRNLFIAGLSLLALLLGLGYSRYKIKQKANKVLEEQQQSINAQNESLRQLLTEREWLLKEIHHRVKNNLQIIMSLMRTQLSHLKSDDAKEAFIESENRVQAIALIHQKLYNTQNFASIGMRTYVADLVSYLGDGLDTREKKVKFRQSVDQIQVDLAQAVPLGLILNEAITNAIKYGFNGNSADISISIQSSEGADTVMIITDKGKGLPDDFDVLTPKSLGMQMMKGLTKQLKGEFDIRNNNGVTVTIRFKLLPVFLPENN
jgi:two-component sensor histidine kinase